MKRHDNDPVAESPEAAADLPDPQVPDPRAVLHDARLTRAQKIATLRRRACDARALDVANDEGMGGVARPSDLPAILAALHELGSSEVPTSPDQ